MRFGGAEQATAETGDVAASPEEELAPEAPDAGPATRGIGEAA
jgi:hypothetical protein